MGAGIEIIFTYLRSLAKHFATTSPWHIANSGTGHVALVREETRVNGSELLYEVIYDNLWDSVHVV
jgi:hypothetical protein